MRFNHALSFIFKVIHEKRTLLALGALAAIIGISVGMIFISAMNGFLFSQVFFSILISFFVLIIALALSRVKLKPGEVSYVDALLRCVRCGKSDFHVHIGQEIESCPQCLEKTQWRFSQIFSMAKSNNEVLKSLALFARHNPQPLFRVDALGVIKGANPASEALFAKESLIGESIDELLPEFQSLDYTSLIENEEIVEIFCAKNGAFYNFVLKGVLSINTVNIYGNDITQIKLAQQRINEQARDIEESISYAWSIQKAMLPQNEVISKALSSYFIFYRPRNIVSGDFYWINTLQNYTVIIAADSTGHGVPGAFMSMLGISLLNEIILREETLSPDAILNKLRMRVIESLATEDESRSMQDGMDMGVVVFEKNKSQMAFAGAFNSLFLLRNGEMSIIPADKMPVGSYLNDTLPFQVTSLQIISGDRFYLFSDGFKDQFGGERDKKFGMRAFRDLLQNSGSLPMEQQLAHIENTFDKYKAGYEQIDDVLVMGFEV